MKPESSNQPQSIISRDPDALLTYKEAGALLRVGRTKLTQLVKKGVVPVVRIGSSVYFRRASLLAWIEKQEQKERRLDA